MFESTRQKQIKEITDNINRESEEKVTPEQVEHWIGSDATEEDMEVHLYGLSVEDGDDRDEDPLGGDDAATILELWEER